MGAGELPHPLLDLTISCDWMRRMGKGVQLGEGCWLLMCHGQRQGRSEGWGGG